MTLGPYDLGNSVWIIQSDFLKNCGQISSHSEGEEDGTHDTVPQRSVIPQDNILLLMWMGVNIFWIEYWSHDSARIVSNWGSMSPDFG